MEITEIKKTYITPEIELIVLDNEISLAMESTEDNDPMTDPNTWPIVTGKQIGRAHV